MKRTGGESGKIETRKYDGSTLGFSREDEI